MPPREINKIEIRMGKFEVHLDNTTKTMKRIEDKIDNFICGAENKFAGKWIEKAFVYGGSVVATALIIAFMALILKK